MSSARTDLDWQAVRRRLATACTAMESSGRLTAEKAKEVMDERAAAIAYVPTPVPKPSEVLEVISFSLGREQFAIETRFVRTVLRDSALTPVPGTPAFVRGATNLRGQVLVVMDLDQLLGLAAGGPRELSWILVLGSEQAEFGVLADVVHEVSLLPVEQVLDAAALRNTTSREYLRGVTPDALMVLDGGVLLDDERMIIDEGEER